MSRGFQSIVKQKLIIIVDKTEVPETAKKVDIPCLVVLIKGGRGTESLGELLLSLERGSDTHTTPGFC